MLLLTPSLFILLNLGSSLQDPVPPSAPAGFDTALWAQEPLLANPVVFYTDEKGRVFVCETYRQETEGVPDNRSHSYWTEDDLRSMTVEDRAAMYLKHHPEYETDWTQKEDRIVMIEDTNGDGFADSSKVFSGGYNE
ncbi:MAG: hypothetical protein MK213_02720, partial [Planctomycetes bacterium]|nr:hypothetical protein [Planctomycetota bacterium]